MRTRKEKAAELMRLAVKGPDCYAPLTIPAHERKQIDALAAEAFRCWADCWLVPLIVDLVPELKFPERFEAKPGASRNQESKS